VKGKKGNELSAKRKKKGKGSRSSEGEVLFPHPSFLKKNKEERRETIP